MLAENSLTNNKELFTAMHLQNAGQDIETSALETWHPWLGLDSF